MNSFKDTYFNKLTDVVYVLLESKNGLRWHGESALLCGLPRTVCAHMSVCLGTRIQVILSQQRTSHWIPATTNQAISSHQRLSHCIPDIKYQVIQALMFTTTWSQPPDFQPFVHTHLVPTTGLLAICSQPLGPNHRTSSHLFTTTWSQPPDFQPFVHNHLVPTTGLPAICSQPLGPNHRTSSHLFTTTWSQPPDFQPFVHTHLESPQDNPLDWRLATGD